jgi:hypothetical protein
MRGAWEPIYMKHTFEIEEGDRQCLLLALAKLSLTRPGWHPACTSRIAEVLGGRTMYEEFRSYGHDPVVLVGRITIPRER